MAVYLIRAVCPSYACRVCRTKTGWQHQRWCRISYIQAPACKECRYYDADKGVCVHPVRKKGGAAFIEKDPCKI